VLRTLRSGRAIVCLVGLVLVFVTSACDSGVPVPPGSLPFNFHVVAEGLVYRSAQPTPEGLLTAFDRFGIRTVINLRGESPGESWWERERETCEAAGVAMIDIRMSAQSLPSRESLLKLYDAFLWAEYPILIHCQGGADRTGAAAAIWRMVVLNESNNNAKAELSPEFFHFEPFAPAMDRLVEVFVPDRDWIADVYDPDMIG